QPNRFKILRILCENSELSNLLISDKEWQGIQMIYKDLNVIYEDNDYMRENYIIIDSFGNLTKNNLHLNNNSLLSYNFEECLKHLNHAKGI
nr:hypothetical protein [Anaeroplasmataceae bacterium]